MGKLTKTHLIQVLNACKLKSYHIKEIYFENDSLYKVSPSVTSSHWYKKIKLKIRQNVKPASLTDIDLGTTTVIRCVLPKAPSCQI